MIFEIIGFFTMFIILSGLSVQLTVIGLYGGLDIGTLPLKDYWWYAPLVLLLIFLWLKLFEYSPFTITIN